MQQVAVNYAKHKFLGKASQHIHQNRPSFETDPEVLRAIEEAQKDHKTHWWQLNKKARNTPEILLNQRDRQVLHRVKKRAWYLDKGCHCCCFNIGLDGIVGLIPGIGDVIGTALALQLVRTACQADIPNWLIAKMTWNVMLDFMIGLTPIAGDILDILFKCNWRNAMLLEEYLILRRMDEIRLEQGQQVVLQPDPSSSTAGDTHNITENDKYGTFKFWRH